MCTQYLHYIHPPMPFPYFILSTTGTNSSGRNYSMLLFSINSLILFGDWISPMSIIFHLEFIIHYTYIYKCRYTNIYMCIYVILSFIFHVLAKHVPFLGHKKMSNYFSEFASTCYHPSSHNYYIVSKKNLLILQWAQEYS
jgi:hypothetical protein